MKKSCALSLLLLAAIIYAYYYFLNQYFSPPADWITSLVLGFFGWMGVGFVRNAFHARRQASLIRRAIKGFIPKDQEVIAAVGTIHPIDRAVESPFLKKECVLYSYEIYTEHRSSGSNSQTTTNKYYSGFSQVPSVIRSGAGSIKLLGFPTLQEVSPDYPADDSAYQNANQYISNTTFEDLSGFKITKAFSAIKEVLTDDDGLLKKDWRLKGDVAIENMILKEESVTSGEQVCAIGRYSKNTGGISPDFKKGIVVTLYPGDPQATAKRVGGGFFRNLIGGFMFVAISNLIAWFILNQYEKSPDAYKAKFAVAESAVLNSDTQALDNILNKHFDINRMNSNGRTLLMIVKDPKIAEILIKKGANPNIKNDEQQTALMYASEDGNLELVKVLVEGGADPNTINNNWNHTAIDRAHYKKHPEIVKYLRSVGAKDTYIDASTGQKITANSAEFKVVKDYIGAIYKADLDELKSYFVSDRRHKLEGIDFSIWQSSRIKNPNFVEGYNSGNYTTITVNGRAEAGYDAVWVYRLQKEGADWKILDEDWITD